MRWLVALLLLLAGVAFAESQGPSPTLGKTESRQPQQQSTSSKEDAAKDQRGTESSPLVVKVLNPPKAEPDATKNPQEQEKQPPTDWWMFGVTGVLAGIALLQLGAFIVQAIRLGQTIKTMDATAERQLRAYLVIEKCDLQYRDDQPVVSIKIKNCGQTPADRVMVYGTIDILQRRATIIRPVSIETLSKARLGAGAAHREDIKTTRPISDSEAAGLIAGTHWLNVGGDVEYTDIFSNTWALPFEFVAGGKYGPAIREGSLRSSTEAQQEYKKA